ncbi:hypothetical protein NRB56_03340 [Nocardia sp. RB56]|uniref:Secreted protein n=1 Tax=Nocardia aurantia TaxID=2585199 RepID=A0A7K0DGX0_9NOCA|nr:hypothetical protein [Nocardia aurantia]
MAPRLPESLRTGTRWLRRFAVTTPGVLVAIAFGAVLLCLVTGLIGASELNDRTGRRDTALQREEPLADAAQRLYVALSAADASAASAFLSGGVESPQIRAQYRQSLTDAANALAAATAGVGDPATRQIVARIDADLPVYTGLVESARANNRQGFPVGSAYLREASALMQNSLLPTAAQLTTQRYAAVRSDQRVITRPPWITVVLLLLVVAGAVAGSRILLRRTNRLFNLGLVAAAAAAVLALVWIVAATVAAHGAIDGGPSGTAARTESLARARILAQQARTDETLELITRGDTQAPEDDFKAKTTTLRDRLGAAAGPGSPMPQQLARWLDGHALQVNAYNGANYLAAVDQAIGTGPDSSTRRFTDLDNALRDAIADSRDHLREDIGNGGDSWSGCELGTLGLMVFAAIAAVGGLWPRLKEFL